MHRSAMRLAVLSVIVATAAAGTVSAAEEKSDAVEKLVEMLSEFRDLKIEEGKNESKTYNEAACFCQETIKAKNEAIKTGKSTLSGIAASIDVARSCRVTEDNTMSGLKVDIKEAEKSVKDAEEEGQKALRVYEKHTTDLSETIPALADAIQVLKESKASGSSLVQQQAVTKRVLSSARVAAALQTIEYPPMEDYKFHSDGIIGVLEGLLDDFRAKKQSVDSDEVKRKQALALLLQDLRAQIDAFEVSHGDAEKTHMGCQQDVDQQSAELSTTSTLLRADTEYLGELSSECMAKKKRWDQHVNSRSLELEALVETIKIVNGMADLAKQDNHVRLVQNGVTLHHGGFVTSRDEAMVAVEAEAEEADARGPSFFQMKSKALAFLAKTPATDDGRDAVIAMLRQKSTQFRSSLLSSLAKQVAVDPLGKVKTLIHELIERLQSEAANEENQKGWCDKTIAIAKQKRRYASRDIQKFNIDLEKSTARRDVLQSDMEELNSELDVLNEDLRKRTVLRGEEIEDNKNQIKDGKSALAAIAEAIKRMNKYYKTQVHEAAEGFEGEGAYMGGQDAAGGIMGMLAVIKSDCSRTISEGEKTEAEQENDFFHFKTDSESSIGVKSKAVETRGNEHTLVVADITEQTSKFEAEVDKLMNVIQELEELKPVCVDTGMSYGDRVGHREDEIESLRKAACILKHYAQADGADSDSC